MGFYFCKENSMENQIVNKKLDQIKSVLSTIQLNSLDDSLVKDNILYFDYEGKQYRCKMPSQKDISNAHRRKDQFYLQSISNDICLTKDQIKKVLKEKQNIDLDLLELEKKELQKQLQDIYIDLATIHPDSSEKIESKKQLILSIEQQFTDIFIKITEYLTPSIESQLEKIYIEYLTFSCSEQKEDNTENWKKIWLSYEDFENENSNLTSECIKHMTFLLIKTNR
jgi:hypothetical protein